jgi:hypothetical protein
VKERKRVGRRWNEKTRKEKEKAARVRAH